MYLNSTLKKKNSKNKEHNINDTPLANVLQEAYELNVTNDVL